MIPEDILKSLYCSLSSNKHFLKVPIRLSCEHAACKSCIEHENDLKSIKCLICENINNLELNSLEVDQKIQASLVTYSEDIKKISEDKQTSTIKDPSLTSNNNGERNYKLLEEKIDARVKSLKDDVDNISEKLQNELKERHEQHKGEIMKPNSNVSEAELVALLNMITNLNEVNLDKLYECQSKLMEAEALIENQKKFTYKLNLELSETEIDESFIGKFEYILDLDEISRCDVNIHDTDVRAWTACPLNDDSYLICEHNLRKITLVDQYFNTIYSVSSINNQTFDPRNAVTNGDHKIYLCDISHHCILMLDLNLNFLKQFGSESGSENKKLNCPSDVFFYDHYLYVCDGGNERIQKLTENLDYIASFNVGYRCSKIKIINQTACVEEDGGRKIAFYDLDKFELKCEHPGEGGMIATHNKYFYVLGRDSKKLTCFDENGVKMESTELIHKIKDLSLVDDMSSFIICQMKLLIFDDNNKVAII